MEIAARSSTAAVAAWKRAVEDPQLQELPWKVETNEHGQLILSPHKVRHSYRQAEIIRLLAVRLPEGRIATELAVETEKGIKVPDVTWASEERYLRSKDADASPIAPEIVIEVLSRSNTAAEMEEKRRLYFQAGAHEVWTCDMDGRMRFFAPTGERAPSEMVPDFPTALD